MVNFPFLDGAVPSSLFYGVQYIFLSLFVLQVCVIMLMILTTETFFNCLVIKTSENSKHIFLILPQKLRFNVKYNIGL